MKKGEFKIATPHPLLRALGRAFQKLRKQNGIKFTDQLAREMGIGCSLMRMIESGEAMLHPKYFPTFIKTYPDIVFERLTSLHCICKLLEHTEMTHYEETYSFLSLLDQNLNPIFESLAEGNDVDQEKQNQRADLIIQYLIPREVINIRYLIQSLDIDPEVLNHLRQIVEKLSSLNV